MSGVNTSIHQMSAFVGTLIIMIGFMLILCIIEYLVAALAYQKVFKQFGYNKAWLAWIPFGNYYGISELAAQLKGNPEKMDIVSNFSISNKYFKFWWIISIALIFLPFTTLSNLLSALLRVFCLGRCFTIIMAKQDNKTEKEVETFGHISSVLPVIAQIKFLTTKTNNTEIH